MSLVSTERNGEHRYAVITMQRPEKLNAFNTELLNDLFAALAELKDDDSISAVVVQGAGGNFSAGYDVVTSYTAPTAYQDWRKLQNAVDLWERVWRYPKPIIAAVEGHCLGGATMFVACADLVVVADDANIGWPSIPLGGGLLSPVSLWHVGMRKAKELSYIAGNSMSGAEAADLGWANRSVPKGEVEEAATVLARRVGKTPLDLLYLKKNALNRVFDRQGFVEALRSGAEWDSISHTAESIDQVKDQMRELGFRGAIKHFTEG
ncbi:enoyl-CoA hydratase/isomerase family protein [Brevibacterium sp. GP-SGM9]|uniref:enoyl-CoA hydratase/isomerase family protein n=1 Tax=unclassified Brevibacterium TaxID=2614124 RepID=UPI001E3A1152|nr:MULTISPECIES: enoyl-CoA hydratase/isomerase family protein [unclassified Brevibacterium]MDK8433426.1 enoyl-CoA hydratase/isomerase family protein [Brevibacterium sp. H-BE7]